MPVIGPVHRHLSLSLLDEDFVLRGGNLLPGIRVKEGESFESALRRFKKKCEKAGIMADLRRHQHFEKPSERRKRKMNAAKRKNIARRSQEV